MAVVITPMNQVVRASDLVTFAEAEDHIAYTFIGSERGRLLRD